MLTLSVGQFVHPIVGPFGGLVRNAPIDMWKLTNAHRYLDQERLSLTLSVCRSEFVCLLIARSGHWNSRDFFLLVSSSFTFFFLFEKRAFSQIGSKRFCYRDLPLFCCHCCCAIVVLSTFPCKQELFFCKVGVIFLGIFTNLVFVAYFVLSPSSSTHFCNLFFLKILFFSFSFALNQNLF